MHNPIEPKTYTKELNPARPPDDLVEKQTGGHEISNLFSIPAALLLLMALLIMTASGAFFNGLVTSEITKNSAPLPVELVIAEDASRVESEELESTSVVDLNSTSVDNVMDSSFADNSTSPQLGPVQDSIESKQSDIERPTIRCKEFWANNGNRCRLTRVRGAWVATNEDWESFGNGSRPARMESSWVSGSFEDNQTIKQPFCLPPRPSSCSIVKSARCQPNLFPGPKQRGLTLSHNIFKLGAAFKKLQKYRYPKTQQQKNWARSFVFGEAPEYEKHGIEHVPEEFDQFYASKLEELRSFVHSKGQSLRICLIWKGARPQHTTENGKKYRMHNEVYNSFIEGARKLGLNLVVIDERPRGSDRYNNNATVMGWQLLFEKLRCDLPALWSLDGSVVEALRRDNGHFLLLETPYCAPRVPSVVNSYVRLMAQEGYMSFGFDGLKGRSVFWRGMPDTRWKEQFEGKLEVTPWQAHEDGHFLLVDQFHHDRSLVPINRNWRTKDMAKSKDGHLFFNDNGVDLHLDWIVSQVRKYDKRNRTIFFKAHPKTVMEYKGKYKVPAGVDKDVTAWTGPEAFKGCFCAITISSNAAVEAVMHGIPVISTDPGSMVWDVSGRLTERDINDPPRPDRQQWLNDLSYAQWRLEEMYTGEPLKQLLLLEGAVMPQKRESDTLRSGDV
eukprot:CAMPEP_0118931280 /NCGR_PEP_ID=MMETSP1169-20130426/7673_1 /TAXON_ID=36882 /ORGANISM="Pyramimonas obovata, Strain CCMP722" /LENGTH=671 /DNA_ID=CAMNT_0006873759 /DNA_START=178 /DNA_END=2190 /DNA_ORIENTATION=-